MVRVRWTAALVAVALAGCDGLQGGGAVSANFFVEECPPDDELDLNPYGFDAAWLATERFSGVLIIQIQEYRVRIEESDSVAVRVEMAKMIDAGLLEIDEANDRIVLADPSTPLVLPVGTEGGFANATLSLFQTCPDFPTLFATSGTLRISDWVIAVDPEDTGRGERLVGTLTATLADAAAPDTPAATVASEFDFEPPRRPTISFK